MDAVRRDEIYLSRALAAGPCDDARQAFIKGASRLTGTALLVGFARAIGLMLEDRQAPYTLVHLASAPLRALPPAVSAVGMFGMQSVLNIWRRWRWWLLCRSACSRRAR